MLVANDFWNMTGAARLPLANSFFEHFGLIAALLMAVWLRLCWSAFIRRRHSYSVLLIIVVTAFCLGIGKRVEANENAAPCAEKRPPVLSNRWQEDWSVLAAPCMPAKPLDDLKYIPLGDDPHSYLSLGANLRERVEVSGAPMFGVGPASANTRLLQRAQASADLRIAQHYQVFVQLADARTYGKDIATPVDRSPPDIEQAFIAWMGHAAGTTAKLRIGRQEMAFDLQHFISVREGTNIRQSFDAVWGDLEYSKWRFIGYATRPVQNRGNTAFDDRSNRHLAFSGVRFERKDVGPGDLSGYYSRYKRSNAAFLDAKGDEHRHVFDLRYFGRAGHADWDVESMLQVGHVGRDVINAWAVGSLAGYALDGWGTPRVGLQIDVASGDRHPGDGRVGTFNPLFPNGYYFTLAGFTGYANIVHIKPSITLKPSTRLSLLAALGFQWRQTENDAIYQQGNVAVPGTAGHGSRWTGMYVQLRSDWMVTDNLISSIEAVHFQAGNAIRSLGGSNADYVGIELKYGW